MKVKTYRHNHIEDKSPEDHILRGGCWCDPKESEIEIDGVSRYEIINVAGDLASQDASDRGVCSGSD